MISKKRKPRRGKIEIDLSGPDGNANCLMGIATSFCKQLERDPKPLMKEMMAGDYEHLLAVFDREFGDFVILYRGQKDEDDYYEEMLNDGAKEEEKPKPVEPEQPVIEVPEISKEEITDLEA